MKVGLIGHSHSVCLMDALGFWRNQLGVPSRATRRGYSNAFDGWDALDTSDKLIHLPNRKIGTLTADLTCAVIFGGSTNYSLVSATVKKDGEITVNPTLTLMKIGQAFAECDVIVSVLFGNELSTKIWLDDLPSYDFVEESLPGPIAPGAQPIDRKFVDLVLAEYVSRVLMPCMVLRQVNPRARFVHILPPPPLQDPSRLKYLEGFGDAMAKYGVLDANLRLKWYRAYVRKMMIMLRQGGIGLVPPPPAAFTAEGFFPEYLSNGLTHGNTQYGAMMWKAVASSLEAQQ